jgi:UDPglucose 6-dehydrogenase
MNKVGIIGYGFVGEATAKGFASNTENEVFWYDKFKESPNTLDEVVNNSEFIFICLPTPMFRDYSGQDITIVEGVIEEIASKLVGTQKVLIIKSTVLPGTTQKFQDKYLRINFAMNPEFLTQAKANEDFLKPARTVIGASNEETGKRVMSLYESILNDQEYFLVGLTEAEMIKYMSNIMLASKVLLANEFYELSEKIGANYKEIYKAVEADPRIGTHLNVPGPDGDLGFGGACFPKDTLGLLSFAKQKDVDMSALNGIWEKNLKIRKNKDWEHMDNAFGRGASDNKK